MTKKSIKDLTKSSLTSEFKEFERLFPALEAFKRCAGEMGENQFKIINANISVLNPETSKQGKKALCSQALHPELCDPLIDVSEMSIEKGYTPLNYLDKDSKVTVTYCLAAAKRHLQKAEMGIDLNTEELGLDGLPTKIKCQHLAQVAYNALMALMILKERPEADDRLFKVGIRK